MLEREIEKHLVKRCKELDILCYKFVSPQHRSVPDRLLVKNGRTIFVELKATGKKPTKAQTREMGRLDAHGVLALYIDSKSAVDWLLEAI